MCRRANNNRLSRFNHTPRWIRSIRKARIHRWNKMSSLNDPAQTRPQMLLSKRWNRKCPIQFHPMYCTHWCHSSFAKPQNWNHMLQTWCRIPVRFSRMIQFYCQCSSEINKTGGFSPISEDWNAKQTQYQSALIRKKLKFNALTLPDLKKKKNTTVWLLSCVCVLLPEERPSSIYEEMHSNDMVVVSSQPFPVFCCRPPFLTNSRWMTCK